MFFEAALIVRFHAFEHLAAAFMSSLFRETEVSIGSLGDLLSV
jgi:hypothetical protein